MAATTRRLLEILGLAGFGLLLWWLAAGVEPELRAPAIDSAPPTADAPRSFALPAHPDQPARVLGAAVEPGAVPAESPKLSSETAPVDPRDAVIRIVNRAGQSVSSARIAIWRGSQAWSEAERPPDESWPVDATGRFTLQFGDAPFLLEASDAFAGRSGLWNAARLRQASRNGSVVTIRLRLPAHVAGRVVDADDAPVPFATVHAEGGSIPFQRGEPRVPATSSCDAAGHFDFESDAGATIQLWASNERALSSNGEALSTPGVDVRVDDAPAEVILRFPRELEISGRLVDAVCGGGLVGQVEVWRTGEDRDADFGEVATDKEGRFDIRFESGGSYTLRGKAYTGGTSLARDARLPEEGGRLVVDLSIDPPATIEGIVLDTSGQLAVGANVYASPAKGALGRWPGSASTQSLADGTFILEPLDPHAMCDIAAGFPEARISHCLLENVPAGTRGLRLVVPGRPELVTIRGRVLAADTREPAAGVQGWWWMSYGEGSQGGQRMDVDATGDFEVLKVPVGATIAVEAYATDYGRSLSPWFEARATAPPVELWLEHRGSLAVQMRDAQARPAANIVLRVSAASPLRNECWSLSTDEQGAARLADLDAGHYELTVPDAAPPVTAKVDVLPGAEATLVVSLPADTPP
ncbi:MAG TPA: carboxypeptidase-like regulatory domain-containing protein [Planctomycetota bacterium]|nr:carboxypeptidase-like regulatory domain-containing protein [Planctomycetota bacterium]